jgi:hypothetical protein
VCGFIGASASEKQNRTGRNADVGGENIESFLGVTGFEKNGNVSFEKLLFKGDGGIILQNCGEITGGFGVAMENVLGLRGPEEGVLEEQRVGLGFLKPGHGLRKVALGIVIVAESESGALSPNAGGMFIGEGSDLVVGARSVEVQITREGRKFPLRGSIFGSIGVERRRRNIRLAAS